VSAESIPTPFGQAARVCSVNTLARTANAALASTAPGLVAGRLLSSDARRDPAWFTSTYTRELVCLELFYPQERLIFSQAQEGNAEAMRDEQWTMKGPEP
jgi:hypothetical protein